MALMCVLGQNRTILFSFTLTGNGPSIAGGNCRAAHLAIPGGSATGHGASLERFCGSAFGTLAGTENVITTFRTPFRYLFLKS